jgi:hypothetical protein
MYKNFQSVCRIGLIILAVLFLSCETGSVQKEMSAEKRLPYDAAGNSPDRDFLATLSSSGVLEAAGQIGLDINLYIMPMVSRMDHSYRRYRWSVGHHEEGGVMISALPPEEETGWTPWERWYLDSDGITRKESWVMYPVDSNMAGGVIRWYTLTGDDLMPRYCRDVTGLEDILRQARIYEAASTIGFDATEILVKPLSLSAREYYSQCRWVVIPHMLANDAPVIYIIPPMHMADLHPWESWYSDGTVPFIHHVHFTRNNNLTTGVWHEFPGAPQRPPEIFGVTWHWFNDLTLKPYMLN